MEDFEAESGGRAEAVRCRWTPKPEQIVILESIFNSGMVNPPKDETVRIRKLLEKFGSVGDANVFYWFQNRRSRSRRRQRQIQATLAHNPISSGSSSMAANADGFLSHNSVFATSNLHYQTGLITVFINGVPTEVGRGPVDIKAMFGGDYVLFHSSGLPLEPNHHGFLLHHGESYFLVPRHS